MAVHALGAFGFAPSICWMGGSRLDRSMARSTKLCLLAVVVEVVRGRAKLAADVARRTLALDGSGPRQRYDSGS